MRHSFNALLGARSSFIKKEECMQYRPEYCSVCFSNKPVKYRTIKHDAVCPDCYSECFNAVPCVACGKVRRAALLVQGEPICNFCYMEQHSVCKECRVDLVVPGSDVCEFCEDEWRSEVSRQPVLVA